MIVRASAVGGEVGWMCVRMHRSRKKKPSTPRKAHVLRSVGVQLETVRITSQVPFHIYRNVDILKGNGSTKRTWVWEWWEWKLVSACVRVCRER